MERYPSLSVQQQSLLDECNARDRRKMSGKGKQRAGVDASDHGDSADGEVEEDEAEMEVEMEVGIKGDGRPDEGTSKPQANQGPLPRTTTPSKTVLRRAAKRLLSLCASETNSEEEVDAVYMGTTVSALDEICRVLSLEAPQEAPGRRREPNSKTPKRILFDFLLEKVGQRRYSF